MIDRLILKNFKVLRNVNVALRPLSLVVGPNGSGKSSLLQGLQLLFRCLSSGNGEWGRIFTRESNPEVLRSKGTQSHMEIGCYGVLLGAPLVFGADLETKEDYIEPAGAWAGQPFNRDTLVKFYKKLAPAVELNLDIRKLSAPSYLKDISRALPQDGEGLAAFLAALYLEHPHAFQLLLDKLRSVVPVVQNLRFQPAYVPEESVSFRVGHELIFDVKGAEGLPARMVSEGTLLTLGLLTLLSASERPGLLLIEDLERGLHPKALANLVKQIRAIQAQDPDLQIVATSHSPYLLDYLEAEEILLTSLDEEGYASVRPLSAHPEYERWKDVMAPGEFWSTVGEKWVTEKAGS